MFPGMRKKCKYISTIVAVLLTASPAAWAGGPPAPSVFSNPLAVILFVIMIMLLIVIGILANILIGAADMKLKNRKNGNNKAIYPVLLLLCLLPASFIFGQDTIKETSTAVSSIGGMPASTFYLMAVVIFLEMGLVIALLINIKLLIRKEKEKLIVIEDPLVLEEKKMRLSWWDRFNRLRPVSQEAELDLGHEYDGIRELNNKLPPWWLYGFYLTIIFAGVYLWRFHVSHNGPSSKQEYEMSIARAELKIKNYLKTKGDAVDENTVTFLNTADDLAAGRIIFIKSCISCHLESGGGSVGPNLTDDFWMHGNDIRSVFKTIRYGINAMPQWQNAYSNKQLAQVASFVKSLHGSNPPGAKAPQGIEIKEDEKRPGKDSVIVKKSSMETMKK
jgi:cytochrome c oxidase cbb3-type subunit III